MVIEPRWAGRRELWDLFLHSGLFPTIMDKMGQGLESHIIKLGDDLKCWGKLISR